MTPSKSKSLPSPSPTHYTPLPPHPPQDQNYIVLPLYYPSRACRCRVLWSILCFILFLTLLYIFWPSDPHLKIVRMRLNKISVHTVPRIAVDISMFVTVRVHNADVYSMEYRGLDVAVGYRGKRLGHVRSDHGHVKAMGSSYVDAEMELKGIDVLSDVVYLLDDLAKGTVPFDAETELKGRLGLLFLDFPLRAKLSCQVLVNTVSHTIARQNCYPEPELGSSHRNRSSSWKAT